MNEILGRLPAQVIFYRLKSQICYNFGCFGAMNLKAWSLLENKYNEIHRKHCVIKVYFADQKQFLKNPGL